jgi:hypothetical protein
MFLQTLSARKGILWGDAGIQAPLPPEAANTTINPPPLSVEE